LFLSFDGYRSGSSRGRRGGRIGVNTPANNISLLMISIHNEHTWQ